MASQDIRTSLVGCQWSVVSRKSTFNHEVGARMPCKLPPRPIRIQQPGHGIGKTGAVPVFHASMKIDLGADASIFWTRSSR